MRVRYSPRSIQDLDDIRDYISKDNPDAAWIVASFIRRSIRFLEEWPYHGRATEKENVRRLVVTNYPYVVYYSIQGDENLIILSVRHVAQER
ncbi:MAG: type II toxin-antitoxin system RelE/ParE family toxin [bacterium]|nr:type II toxin-antitoxin system RelE/ParE family toxin [bacterium]